MENHYHHKVVSCCCCLELWRLQMTSPVELKRKYTPHTDTVLLIAQQMNEIMTMWILQAAWHAIYLLKCLVRLNEILRRLLFSSSPLLWIIREGCEVN